MKFNLLLVLATFGLSAFATSGRVICSLKSPQTTGFEVIKTHAKPKDYLGSYVVNNLRISGSYWTPQNLLKLSVASIDENGEDVQEILFTETKLNSGETWHSKTQHGDLTLDMYCYYIESVK